MNRALWIGCLALVTSLGTAPALAASTPDPAAAEAAKRMSSLSADDFEVKEDGPFSFQMRIKGIGDNDEGYIDYELNRGENGEKIVSILGIRGVKNVKGVGEALKKEVLRLHPNKQVVSQLAEVNRSKLLKEWAKDFPHKSGGRNGESLRSTVPALKFPAFNYVITAEPSSTSAGTIKLTMTSTGNGKKGKIVISNPIDLDKVLLASPERSSIDEKTLTVFMREKNKGRNAANARDAKAELLAAAKKAPKGLQTKAAAYATAQMRDVCGSNWASSCQFVEKSGSFLVSQNDSSKEFLLSEKLESWIDEYTKKEHAAEAKQDAKEEKEERAESEKGAKDSADYIRKIAKDMSKKASFSSDEMEKHLFGVMDKSCGRGGSDGSGWSDGCSFSRKGSSYLVQPRKQSSSASFAFEPTIENAAKDFAKKKR